MVQTIGRLGLDPAPPVAVVPLGTGNDLARSFGWGGMFEKKWIKDHEALHRTLGWFGAAAATTLDRWRLTITAPGPGYFTRKKPYGFVAEGTAEVRPGSAGVRGNRRAHACTWTGTHETGRRATAA